MKIMICLTSILMFYSQANASKLLGVGLGFNRGVLNLGVTIDSDSTTGSVGGHLFVQSAKTSVGIGQVTSLAAHIKINIVDQHKFSAELNPGFGLHMIDTGGAGSSVKNTVGPTIRMRFAYKISSRSSLGLDRLEIWNWFDEAVTSSASYTGVVFVTEF